MTDVDVPPPGDVPQPTPEKLMGCSISIECPPMPKTGSKVMKPSFKTTGTFSGNHNQHKIEFRLVKGNDIYAAPDLAVIGFSGTWAQSGWSKVPLGGSPTDGSGYRLTVTMYFQFNNTWIECASATVEDITINSQNGDSCP